MLKLSFNTSDERLAQNALMLELQAKIVGEKLQGQVLAHRSGKLAGSIRVVPAIVEGTSVVGIVQGAGGPAFYGRVHEFGGTFDIPTHQRKVGATKEKIRARLGGTVRAHTATFPQRSFMRTSLEEMRGRIFEGMTAAVSEELAK